jgi:hypothetical protein
MADKTAEFRTGNIRHENDARRICGAHVERLLKIYPGKIVYWNGDWKTEGTTGICYYTVED